MFLPDPRPAQAAMQREKDHLEQELAEARQVIAILVQQAGGEAVITDEELLEVPRLPCFDPVHGCKGWHLKVAKFPTATIAPVTPSYQFGEIRSGAGTPDPM